MGFTSCSSGTWIESSSMAWHILLVVVHFRHSMCGIDKPSASLSLVPLIRLGSSMPKMSRESTHGPHGNTEFALLCSRSYNYLGTCQPDFWQRAGTDVSLPMGLFNPCPKIVRAWQLARPWGA